MSSIRKIQARSWTDEQLIVAVKNSKTTTEVARKLGLTTFGANSKTIKKRIIALQIDTTHFWSRGEQLTEARKYSKSSMTHDELFTVNAIDRQWIKRVIIRDILIPYECAICHINNWLDNVLSLHLDHINGVSNDNTLSNLRFLCPNCHSQTSTYCGKKLKSIKYNDPYCVDCNVPIHKKATRCRKCAAKRTNKPKVDWPDTSTLIEMVSMYGYTHTGKLVGGVYGNSVKKRIRVYPDFVRDPEHPKQFTKIEWPQTSHLLIMVEEAGYEQTGKNLGVSGNAVRYRIKNHPAT